MGHILVVPEEAVRLVMGQCYRGGMAEKQERLITADLAYLVLELVIVRTLTFEMSPVAMAVADMGMLAPIVMARAVL